MYNRLSVNIRLICLRVGTNIKSYRNGKFTNLLFIISIPSFPDVCLKYKKYFLGPLLSFIIKNIRDDRIIFLFKVVRIVL